MFTLIGWSESQDSASLVNIAALADPHVRVEGDFIAVPDGVNQLAGLYALGPNLTAAQVLSPSLRRILNMQLGPLDVGAEPVTLPPFLDYTRSPIVLDPEEQLSAQMAEDAAGASRGTVLAWLSDKPLEPVKGDMRTVRATNTSTLVANAWTNGGLTFDQTLPEGKYQLVGARGMSAGLQAFRFVGVGWDWRPGAIGFDAVQDEEQPIFRNGGLGVWLEFKHNTPPTVDFLSNSADTSQVVFLDLIKMPAA